MQDRVSYEDCFIRVAIPALDTWRLYEDLRIEDMLEAIGLGFHPYKAVTSSFETSDKAYTIVSKKDRNIVCSFGVCKSDSKDLGIVWMLGTHRVLDIQNTFIRHSKTWIKELMGNYRGLINIVSDSNTASIRWLKWLGADFLREKPKGFREFIIYNKD